MCPCYDVREVFVAPILFKSPPLSLRKETTHWQNVTPLPSGPWWCAFITAENWGATLVTLQNGKVICVWGTEQLLEWLLGVQEKWQFQTLFTERILKTFLTQQLGALWGWPLALEIRYWLEASGSSGCSYGDLQIPNHVLCQVLRFRTSSVRSPTFLSFLSLSYQFWKYFEWTKPWCFCLS